MHVPDTDCEAWIGRTLIDWDDRRVGTIAEVYLNKSTSEQLWMVVRMGRFAPRQRFVPLAGAVVAGDAIRTPHRKHEIAGAPEIDPEDQLGDDAVLRIYRHYGRPLDGCLESEIAAAPAEAPEPPPPVTAPNAAPPAGHDQPDESHEPDEPEPSPIADRVLGYLTPPR